MIFIAGAFVVCLLNVLVALALSLHLNVSEYVDISMMCGVLGEGDSACRGGAVGAGLAMLEGLAACLVLAFAFNGRLPRIPPLAIDEEGAFGWCLLATVFVLGAHIATEASGIQEVTRIREITQFSSFISLENLLWPLLLQFLNSSRSARLKLMYFALLLPIVSLSPYRGVLLSVIVFGLCLPVVASVAGQNIQWSALLRQRQPAAKVALGLAVAGLLVFAMYTDTRGRASDLAAMHPQGGAEAKLVQRLAYPLFQAHFAERIASQDPLPTAWDEILHKLRLKDSESLNENLYGRVYGDGSVGEMTSLYYGEATANGVSHPVVWIVVGPLLLVAVWLMLRRFGYEVGTVVGIAIWRGSLGGVASVIPALFLQILAVAALSRRAR